MSITKPFYLGIYEVTKEEFYKVFRDRNPGAEGASKDHPIEGITADDARKFCRDFPTNRRKRRPAEPIVCPRRRNGNMLAGRIPSHRSIAAIAWSRKTPISIPTNPGATHHSLNSLGHSTPVGNFPPNGFGLFDMHGNVAEYCEDGYLGDAYKDRPRPARDPFVPHGPKTATIARGGFYGSGGSQCRSAYRGTLYTIGTNSTYDTQGRGFRVACDVKPAN